MTASIRRDVEAALEKLHHDAGSAAAEKFASEEPSVSRDTSLRWTLTQILGEESNPLGSR